MLVCRIVEELTRRESGIDPFWRPAVLPPVGEEVQEILQQFSSGETNLLITVAGNDLVAGIPLCSLIIRSDLHHAT